MSFITIPYFDTASSIHSRFAQTLYPLMSPATFQFNLIIFTPTTIAIILLDILLGGDSQAIEKIKIHAADNYKFISEDAILDL